MASKYIMTTFTRNVGSSAAVCHVCHVEHHNRFMFPKRCNTACLSLLAVSVRFTRGAVGPQPRRASPQARQQQRRHQCGVPPRTTCVLPRPSQSVATSHSVLSVCDCRVRPLLRRAVSCGLQQLHRRHQLLQVHCPQERQGGEAVGMQPRSRQEQPYPLPLLPCLRAPACCKPLCLPLPLWWLSVAGVRRPGRELLPLAMGLSSVV